MTFKQLEYFLKVAETLNMTRAAKELYISQPSLSVHIKRLEDEMGGALFSRRDNALTLTTAGAVLVREAQELFEKLNELKSAVHTAQKITNQSLKIRYLPGPFRDELPNLILNFRQEHPDCRIDLKDESWNNLTDILFTDDYDVAFYLCLGEYEIPGTDHIEFFKSQTTFMMSKEHPLACNKKLRFEDIQNEMIVTDVYPKTAALEYCSIYEVFASHKKTPNIIHTESLDTIFTMVQSNLAIGLISEKFTENLSKDIVCVPMDELPTTSTGIYWRKSNRNPFLLLFLQYIQSVL